MPKDIPSYPNQTYIQQGWKGWGDFLGSGQMPFKNGHYREFENARHFVQTQGLKSVEEWHKYCKSATKPDDIPSSPKSIYKNEGWKGMPDFLVSGRKVGGWLPFEEARKITRGLGLKKNVEWEQYCKSANKRNNI